MHLKWLAALTCMAAASGALAQIATPDPDWRELEAPPPPALRTDGLIPLDIPRSALRFGVDPRSVAIGADAIVRYVVVATSSSGTVNAMYEGVRCSTGEMKVYARHNPDSGWVAVRDADWQPLREGPQARHSLTIARTGACVGAAPNRNPAQIVRDLRAPVDRRFDTN
jgi:hypothetical protein